MLIKILIGLVVIVVGLFVYAATQKAEYTFSRSVKITALPEAIFPYVNDVQKFNSWNPWVKVDPAVKNTFEGPIAGVGAMHAWNGNREVGAGKMTIVESTPNALVRMKLDYERPMTGTSYAVFTLTPEGSQTVVTWSFNGHNNLICRVMCIFMNMEKMITGTFDKGLADLKSIIETKK